MTHWIMPSVGWCETACTSIFQHHYFMSMLLFLGLYYVIAIKKQSHSHAKKRCMRMFKQIKYYDKEDKARHFVLFWDIKEKWASGTNWLKERKGGLKLSGTRLGRVRQLKLTSQLVLDSLGSEGEELSRPPTDATGAVSHQLFEMVL